MARRRYVTRTLGALIALMALMAGTARAAGDPLLNAKLEEAIAKVRSGKDPTARFMEAQHLAEMTKGVNPKSVDDKTVADMVSLLDDPDDGVRPWVVCALGNLGRRAKVAVPKLLALLPAADCGHGSRLSAAVIRPALKRMGVKPPPFDPTKCK